MSSNVLYETDICGTMVHFTTVTMLDVTFLFICVAIPHLKLPTAVKRTYQGYAMILRTGAIIHLQTNSVYTSVVL